MSGEERKRSIGENQSDENRFKGDGFSDEDVNDTESLEEEDDDDEVLFEPSEKLPLVPEDTSDHDEDDNEIDEEVDYFFCHVHELTTRTAPLKSINMCLSFPWFFYHIGD